MPSAFTRQPGLYDHFLCAAIRQTVARLALQPERIPIGICHPHNIAHAQLADGSLIEGQLELRQLVEFVRLTELGAVDWLAVRTAFSQQGRLALSLHILAAQVLLSWRPPPALYVSDAARPLLARAIWLSRHPGFDRALVYLLRPLRQLARALSSSKNRKRLGRNLASRAWWQRQVKKFKP